ncbi:MAG: hypothetical protein ABFD70_12595 [Syntrophaceae bacterium]|nr:hypothetical protein [Deltaproteobacteria bacterium]
MGGEGRGSACAGIRFMEWPGKREDVRQSDVRAPDPGALHSLKASMELSPLLQDRVSRGSGKGVYPPETRSLKNERSL